MGARLRTLMGFAIAGLNVWAGLLGYIDGLSAFHFGVAVVGFGIGIAVAIEEAK